ncbi:NAD(P)H-hydrate dehydratase [Agromyces badenianii]|uniref:ADP-dependent (S)-NAD(P)H-hydrate dehydratase n=1 Tax=Agromyces badenianii TaxID=2080742 RepID=A0A2S0WUP5_9MICO|nr:ADP/ATP-dependent (S)-NAD(P)H-hydrate dehydratase [Agromyces badenianii]AWB95020.1 NAD(P)H-hydrate dehydratase [Agromyces badenianii]PWC03096.1 NAD(P)H-hydrate dehydratase [Agromyces badenianii]
MDSSWQEWTAADAAEWIVAPAADDDKYSRGVLGVVAGSPEYPGAAVLAVEAAHRAGLGMVRYTGPRAVRTAVLARRPETVTSPGRVQAWLVGSGIDPGRRSFMVLGDLQGALASRQPVVLDAGALDLVGTHTAPTVITPHVRELAALLASREIETSVAQVREAPAEWALRAAGELGVAVLLKGAVTHICDPDGDRYTVTARTHWLASAGTGDVLGGILGALVATHHQRLTTDAEALSALAATAAWVHGEAARRATEAVDGGPVTALDIASAVPRVIGALLAY